MHRPDSAHAVGDVVDRILHCVDLFSIFVGDLDVEVLLVAITNSTMSRLSTPGRR